LVFNWFYDRIFTSRRDLKLMTCNFDNNIIDIGRGLAFVIGVIIGIIIHSKMGEKLPKVDIEGGGRRREW